MFTKGTSGNKKGRPSGSKNKVPDVEDLVKMIKKVGGKKQKGKSLLQHLVERAYISDAVLIAIYKKQMPDLKSVDIMGVIGSVGISDEDAEAFQAKLRKRLEDKK